MSAKLAKRPLAQPTIEPALVKDGFDHILYHGIRENAGNLQSLIKEDPDRDVLASDVFSSLYKNRPIIRSESKGLPRKLMETLLELPEYKALREHTRLDDISSAMGTLRLAPHVLESFEEARQKVEQKCKEREQRDKDNPSDQGAQQPKDGGSDGEGEGQDGDQDIDEEVMDGLRQACRSGLKEAQESAEEWDGVSKAWGVGKDELGTVSTEAKFVLAEKLLKSSKLRAIADMAGRLIQMANAAAAHTPVRGMDEVVDVVTGNDLSEILPDEWMKLDENPELFMKDYLEDNLMMYNLHGVENQGYGPIIIELDISPSMEGEREVFAKAVVLAFMFLAEKQNRGFGLVTFGSEVHETLYIPAGQKSTIEQKMAVAAILCDGGGTNFYLPLKAAFQLRQQTPLLNPADFLFITDGECRMTEKQHEEIQELKLETHVRIQGIAICDNSHRDKCTGDTLDRFSDNLAVIDRLGELQIVKGLLANAAALKSR